MNLKSLFEKVGSTLREYTLDGKTFVRKSIPLVLVIVFASVTAIAALGVQVTEQGYMGTLETEKQKLETEKQELADTLADTEALLNQLKTVQANTEKLLEEAEEEEKAVADRIAELKKTYEILQDREQQRWILPIQYKMCTSYFGYRNHPIMGEGKFHYGVDLAADSGTPIVAARSGTVTVAAYEEDNAGYYVNIDHLDGFESRYMHMSKFIVTEGQFVIAGQIIGYCGATGAATGYHLHFGIYQNNEAVNPADYIDLY